MSMRIAASACHVEQVRMLPRGARTGRAPGSAETGAVVGADEVEVGMMEGYRHTPSPEVKVAPFAHTTGNG